MPRKSDPFKQSLRNKERSERLRAIIDEWKLSKGQCVQCGLVITVDTIHLFDCDHIDPSTKKFKIAKGRSARYKVKDIQDELDKCQLMCAGCHAMRSRIEKHYKMHIIDRDFRRNENQPSLFD